MTAQARSARLRGGPLMMLVLLLAGWSGARALWWENPFAGLSPVLELPLAIVAAPPAMAATDEADPPATMRTAPARTSWPLPLAVARWRSNVRRDPRLVSAHHLVWVAGLRGSPAHAALAVGAGDDALTSAEPSSPAHPPFLPAPAPAALAEGRWSVDGWAFWRQGSDAAPVSQGRVPIYGASQAGAVLQYRLSPGSARDPRLYARAYRALVRRGESELALGASARPFARVPLRVAGEVRYTDAAFSDTIRPAAYVVTELAPVALPYGAQIEAYGQAGWVGGPDPTGFADGQASVTGEVRKLAALTDNSLRLSLGAAAWGGAQKDAQRIDIGPTLRFDVTLGQVPARLSVDWRERVGGDAGPDSGLAATLSTRF